MINPILASSARRRMRSMRAPLILTLYVLLLLAFACFATRSLNRPFIHIDDMRNGLEAYVMMMGLQFFLTILVTPALTCASIAGERERQTLDLLLVTNTGSLGIVLGKLLESFAFVALMIFSTLPMMLVTLITGGVTVMQALTALLFMLVTAFGALSIGLICSALFGRTVTATIVAYLVIFLIGVGTLLPMRYEVRRAMASIDRDLSNLALLSQPQLLRLMPKSILVNPGVGFLALMADQTMLLERTFSMIPSGERLIAILKAVGLTRFVWLNMAAVGGLGLLLTLLSAPLVRPRRRRRKKK